MNVMSFPSEESVSPDGLQESHSSTVVKQLRRFNGHEAKVN
jgi:hypothetical protein